MSRITSWSRTQDVSASTTVTFAGLRVLAYNELSVVVDTNQDGKVTVEQGIDASQYQFTDEKYTYANKPSDLKFPVLAEYARLKYENLEAVDTSITLAAYAHQNGSANIYNSEKHIVLSDNAHLANSGTTSTANVQHLVLVDVYGNANPATDLTVQYSVNDSTFYDTIHSVSASGDFHMVFDCGAKYLRLKNTTADTSLTAIVSGKYS